MRDTSRSTVVGIGHDDDPGDPVRLTTKKRNIVGAHVPPMMNPTVAIDGNGCPTVVGSTVSTLIRPLTCEVGSDVPTGTD